jgi:Gluconate 2-dehydrogenase subunit 3
VSSRRQFLVRTMCFALVPAAVRAVASQRDSSGTTELTPSDLETVAAAMDEIIPAGDGMPAASMAGGPHYLRYLGWQYATIQGQINQFLEALERASVSGFQQEFRRLRPDQRLQVLTAIEKNQATTFSSFIRYVYESYYTNPSVIGPNFCSPPRAVPEDDEALIEPVRKLKHMYRELP